MLINTVPIVIRKTQNIVNNFGGKLFENESSYSYYKHIDKKYQRGKN